MKKIILFLLLTIFTLSLAYAWGNCSYSNW